MARKWSVSQFDLKSCTPLTLLIPLLCPFTINSPLHFLALEKIPDTCKIQWTLESPVIQKSSELDSLKILSHWHQVLQKCTNFGGFDMLGSFWRVKVTYFGGSNPILNESTSQLLSCVNVGLGQINQVIDLVSWQNPSTCLSKTVSCCHCEPLTVEWLLREGQ